jgi:hypothetical protein
MVDQRLTIKQKNNMEYLPVFGIMFIVVGLISWRWVVGIDYMKENHPDYTGDDLFGEFDENDKNQIGNG